MNPPSLLFDEVEDLRGKLAKYKELEERTFEGPVLAEVFTRQGTLEKTGPVRSRTPSPPLQQKQQQQQHTQPYKLPDTHISTMSCSNIPDNVAKKDVVPSSPLRGHFRAYLPDNQHTMIKCKPGQTVIEVLRKKMSMRAYDADLFSYNIYRKDTKERIEWEADISTLDSWEVVVELPGAADTFQSACHNFIRKTFFRFALCDACRKLLFSGFRCVQCGWRFHQKCFSSVPPKCQSAEYHHYHKRLLAKDEHVTNSNLPLTPRPIGHRERSISAPNVNMIGQNDSDADMAILQKALGAKFKNTENAERATISGGVIRPVSSSNKNNSIYSTLFTPPPHDTNGNIFKYNNVASPPYTTTTQQDSSPSTSRTSQAQPTQQVTTTTTTPSKPRHRSKSHSDEPRRARRRDSNDDWEINHDEVKVGARIGSGSYGTVYKGTWHGTCAVKMLNVKDPSQSQIQAFKNEAAVLRKTRHHNILLFMGCMSKPNLAIVTQWCEGLLLTLF